LVAPQPTKCIGRFREGADYIGVGPVYETPTKSKTAAGLDYVRYAAQHSPIPWFAIGELMNNVNDVISAGAERVAVVRALMQAEQPTLVTQYFFPSTRIPEPDSKASHV